jgi:hypothetical protein
MKKMRKPKTVETDYMLFGGPYDGQFRRGGLELTISAPVPDSYFYDEDTCEEYPVFHRYRYTRSNFRYTTEDGKRYEYRFYVFDDDRIKALEAADEKIMEAITKVLGEPERIETR